MIALFLVCIGIGFAGYAAFSGDRLGCVVETLLGLLWLWVNKPVEGPILVTLSPTHGITLADLFSPFCFAIAISAGTATPVLVLIDRLPFHTPGPAESTSRRRSGSRYFPQPDEYSLKQ